MTRLEYIPQPEFDRHEKAGTLGDSEELSGTDLKQFDAQLRPYGLHLVVFDNGAAINWFIERIEP